MLEVDITESAQDYLAELLNKQNTPGISVRMFVNDPGTSRAETCIAYCRPGEEKEGDEKNATHIRGLFGPSQTMWTFFMFLHFVVAGVFIIFGMMAFSNFSLNEPYIKNIIVMILMIFIWFLLYVIARQMREKSHEQMDELEKLYFEIIEI